MVTTHIFRAVGSYTVSLTVTDQRATSNTISKAVVIVAPTNPTATFTFSPATPGINQTIFFNASASRPAADRTLVSYNWDFGKGQTATGVTTSKLFTEATTYVVTLKVTDDVGAFATTSSNVTVTNSGVNLQAILTASPTAGVTTATSVNFDGSASTAGAAPITNYTFIWGDGTSNQSGTSSSGAHQFTKAGTYLIRLTVTDAEGRTATTTISVTVG